MKKKILIADDSKEWLKAIAHCPDAKKYHLHNSCSGPDFCKKLARISPDLVVIDLMLPKMHGIELLKQIRSHPKKNNIGVIITSSYAMLQNHHAALMCGANYFLNKPTPPSFLFSLIEKYFEGTLEPEPFTGLASEIAEGEHCYLPKMHHSDRYIKFWGTRGSNPVSGASYVRYGGNTSCLEIRDEETLVIIDAGTGIRVLGKRVAEEGIKNVHLFIGHTHWDHITGFPFFAPLYDSNCHLTIWAPVGFETSTRDLFTDMLAYAYFPVRLDDIKARLTFKDLRDGQSAKVGNIRIQSSYAHHPGPTLCFKVTACNRTFGYATDNELLLGYHGNPTTLKADDPLLQPYQPLIHFFKECDFLIHEAQYTPIEYQERVGWGHSSIPNVCVLIKYCGIKDWIVTHHDPQHTDILLQTKLQLHHDILTDCDIDCRVRLAYDGLLIPL